ncbi:MnuA family membrane nuclease [Mycoplasma struthionis]|uniref:Endonuclease/exonuclease/phosphatase domain-containing protein n=1 Tax=Mycoplasma struthionis TaxID=538220 RepID=A0A502MIH5_9MOLU|nr:endonuclease/exonuclease/phosphatase family protein [Mycoplasma struthionis]TPI01546.1 hypothetical protein FJM01_02145 [Mycoplasma struthionis]
MKKSLFFNGLVVSGLVVAAGVGAYFAYKEIKKRDLEIEKLKRSISNIKPANSGSENTNINNGSETNNNNNNNNNGSGNQNDANVTTESSNSNFTNTTPVSFSENDKYIKPKNHLRIGHWNIENFGKSNGKAENEYKVQKLAEVIYKTKFDIIGLTEVNFRNLDRVKLIVDALNTYSNSAVYGYIGQNNVSSDISTTSSAEDIAIVYRKDIATPIAFKDGSVGASFKGHILNGISETEYVRPPYGALFKIKDFQSPVVTFFAHFDSPGAKNGGSFNDSSVRSFDNFPIASSQGRQEVSEAFGLPKAFEFFKEKAGNEAAILFGGDTNIKKGNHDIFTKIAKENDFENYYKVAEDKYKSSLGNSRNYSEPYDKILFKENNEYNFLNATEAKSFETFKNVPFVVDTVNGFDNGLFNKEESIKLWKKSNPNKASDSITNLVLAKSISDHAPVFVDIIKK